jgi:predicted RecB family nuclease
MTPPTDEQVAGVRLGPSAAGRCRRRIHLDAAHPDQQADPPAAARRALDELAGHREAVLTAIQAATAPLADTTATPALLLRPDTEVGSRIGSPDLLVWIGDGYAPVIVRAHRTRDAGAGALTSLLGRPAAVGVDATHRARRHRGDRLALAHHYRQLAELGWASGAAQGGVIGYGTPTDGAGRPAATPDPDDDGAVIVWHRLDTPGSSALADYDRRFTDRLAVATAAATGGTPLAQPSRVAECRRCPWWPRCGAELRSAGDVSLLLSGDDVDAARAAGVCTVGDLARLGSGDLARLPLVVGKPGTAQVRARAWLRGAPLVRVGARAAVRRADVEVDVDAESYGEDGAYLWGATLSGADVGIPHGYRSFVTWDRLPSPRQGVVFGEFFAHLMRVRAAAAERGLSFAAFCYARQAEERWMLGLARRYGHLPGVPAATVVDAFCRSEQWVDLLLEIRRQFVVPGSLRLKELAGAMGFRWRDPEPGGENSMAWYREAVGSGVIAGDGAGPAGPRSRQMAERLLRYNEDDVLATLAVRRWITEHREELPTVADLEADPL